TPALSCSPSTLRLGGRTLRRIWSTVPAHSGGGCLTLLKCIEAAVGARIVSVERTPRRRIRISAHRKQQDQSGKHDAYSQFHSPYQCRSKFVLRCAPESVTGSIKVASSGLPGLLTRFDTGHIPKASSGKAGLRSTTAPPDSHGPKFSGSRITGIRSWIAL